MPWLTVVGPGGASASYRFDADRISLGRAESNDVVVTDALVSREHLELRREGASWLVRDLSRNGSLLNGLALRGTQPLRDGDDIQLGRTVVAFSSRSARDEVAATETRSRNGGDPSPQALVGRSPAMAAVRAAIAKVAPTSSTVLITGESGTGKELVARLIHLASGRREAPFAVVNCPALQGGLVDAELFGVEKGAATGVVARLGRLERARGGTLLLDEIGDLELAAQAKILRFLQDHAVDRVGGSEPVPVDVRLLAATHHDLEAAIENGAFRRDLYHRLDVIRIHVPALRERREDVAPLLDHFLGDGSRFSADALELLEGHDWPGNIRELAHLVERVTVLARGAVLEVEDLPDAIRKGAKRRAVAERGGDTVDDLYRTVVEGGASFWEAVRDPFLRRELSHDDAKAFVQRAWEAGGRSYRGMSRLVRLEREYKRLLNFLDHHGLGVEAARGRRKRP